VDWNGILSFPAGDRRAQAKNWHSWRIGSIRFSNILKLLCALIAICREIARLKLQNGFATITPLTTILAIDRKCYVALVHSPVSLKQSAHVDSIMPHVWLPNITFEYIVLCVLTDANSCLLFNLFNKLYALQFNIELEGQSLECIFYLHRSKQINLMLERLKHPTMHRLG